MVSGNHRRPDIEVPDIEVLVFSLVPRCHGL